MASPRDPAWIAFLQWALPRRGLRWRGFRKVRRQVVRRIDRRIRALGLDTLASYREYLETHPREWEVFDVMCRVTISRFFRDRHTFELLGERILPEIARRRGDARASAWSAGCASGEEAYSIALLWHGRVAPRFPGARLEVLGTDVDPKVLARAEAATYTAATLREVPADLLASGFSRHGEHFAVRPEVRRIVRLCRHDIRDPPPPGTFDLVACRNLAMTYFTEDVQARVLGHILEVLVPGGVLVLGCHESPPPGSWPLQRLTRGAPLWRRVAAGGRALITSGRW